MFQKLKQKLFTPVDSITSEIFIRFFGLVILMQVWSYQEAGFIKTGILAPKLLFTYDFFHWINRLPADMMNAIPVVLIVCGLLIAINRFRRVAMAVFLLLFTYLFLLEKSYYNNHFYLMILLSFLFLFYKPKKNTSAGTSSIPFWFLFLLQVQMVIVYFYGGIAKLNYDWLVHMEPMEVLLKNSMKSSAMPSFNDSSFALYLLTYGGLIFDLTIGFLLWRESTRRVAIILCLVFHSLNFLMFNYGGGGDIGIFPIMMMASCILFVTPETFRKKFAKWIPSTKAKEVKPKKNQHAVAAIVYNQNQMMVKAFIISWLLIQLLVPFRHLLYAGNTSWTSRGSRFAWRMKIHVKDPKITYYYQLAPSDSMKAVNLNYVINTMQQYMLGEDPSMLLQLAEHLGRDLRKSGFPEAEIKASVKVSLNERPYQFVVDSTKNLLELKHHPVKPDEWILPPGN